MQSEEGARGGDDCTRDVPDAQDDGASGDAEAEAGEGPIPGLAGESAELVCGVGELFAAVSECLVLSLGVKGRELADQSTEVAYVGAVLGTVLVAEVEDFVEWDGAEVEGDLLEVEDDRQPRPDRRPVGVEDHEVELVWSACHTSLGWVARRRWTSSKRSRNTAVPSWARVTIAGIRAFGSYRAIVAAAPRSPLTRRARSQFAPPRRISARP